MIALWVIIGVVIVAGCWWFIQHQRRLGYRAHLMQEALRNKDFTFRLPTRRMFSGERAMQETLNKLGESIRQQVSKSEVETWERLTRVLTHEIMNATAPITSISQSLMSRQDVKGTPLEGGVQAIYETSRHLSEFVANYRKMSELEKPVLGSVRISAVISDISKAYPQLEWSISVPADILVEADAGMLRQVLVNLVKNAVEADAKKIVIDADVIATYAGSVAVECFGIVGMAAVNMKDGLVKLLKTDYLSHGIDVVVEDNEISLDFHVIISYGVSIATVTDNLDETVRYKVGEFTGMKVKSINVFVEGVRVID